jgi:hypothetical protein
LFEFFFKIVHKDIGAMRAKAVRKFSGTAIRDIFIYPDPVVRFVVIYFIAFHAYWQKAF